MTEIIDIQGIEAYPQQLSTVLTVAGSDSSGGAGIEADIKSITANGGYALTTITALTAQNTYGVDGIKYTDADTLKTISEAIFKDIRIDAIKTGLLTPDSIDVLSTSLEKFQIKVPLVIDPVMISSSGFDLTSSDILESLIQKLGKFCTLLTPNYIEAQNILKIYGIETKKVENYHELQKLAKLISEKTKISNILLKGGHSPWDSSYVTDILYLGQTDEFKVFRSNYLTIPNTHGTGCTLASTIATKLAQGYSLTKSVQLGISYVQNAIQSSSKVTLFHDENGPLNHIYNVSKRVKSFADYLITHPKVAKNWSNYINHDFVSLLAHDKLKPEQFHHFVKQDFKYLENYARIHSIALSKAPDFNCIYGEVEILNSIHTEMNKHSSKFDKTKIVELSEACQNYVDYLFKVAATGSFLEIQVALSPCLFGYYYAAIPFKTSKTTQNDHYIDWLDTYTSDNFKRAVETGKELLDAHSKELNSEQLNKLVDIFNNVCSLEEKFWDEALQQ
ncbi:hypothetical protein WICMUC_004194 [Wickerhamomyces mucosus]|uniref:Uncharacterized protein n=1 Tax=Wickerhamomyces mucosus TaxID=1378264 RepID=A0A9P8TB70_9ASCO|nr:hypothetical protein WICMUC_004194 [Wickerhamomyces mucosus]